MHNALTATSRRRREPSSTPAKVRVCRSQRIQWCISAADAVISFPLDTSFSLSSDPVSSLSLSLALSFSPLRAAYSRRQAKACTLLSTYSVRCAGVLSVRVYYKSDCPRYDPTHQTTQQSLPPTLPFVRLLLVTRTPPLFFLPYARKTRPSGYNPLPLNPLVPHTYTRKTINYI